MKIIEALKKATDLTRKAEDIRGKLKKYCSDLDAEIPVYETPEKQKKQISEWLQSHSDILKEIIKLKISIQNANLNTNVTVEVSEGERVTKTISEWIMRRDKYAKLECEAWESLTKKGLTPRNYKKSQDDPEVYVAQVRKYYSQEERDRNVELYTSERSRIDAALEIANAITDI